MHSYSRFLVVIALLLLGVTTYQSYALSMDEGSIPKFGSAQQVVHRCQVVGFEVRTDGSGDMDQLLPSAVCSADDLYVIRATVNNAIIGQTNETLLAHQMDVVPVAISPSVAFVNGYELEFKVRKHTP